MLSHVEKYLFEIEADPDIIDREQLLRVLRKMGLGDFSQVMWSLPLLKFNKITSLLPRMAADDIQISWTGNCGTVLLGQSLNFVRSVAETYTRLTGHTLDDSRILDFGCGYGRFLRLFSFFSSDVWGVDPWDQSLKHCREAGIVDKIAQSDYLPTSLPISGEFDLVYAFSVFTHLSNRATDSCLSAIRRHMKKGGILCLTIRPKEYWRVVYPQWSENTLKKIEDLHEYNGFSFVPHDREKVDGDVTYGDVSMSVESLAARAEGFHLVGVDSSIDDLYQRYIFLEKVE